jgi:hypothetical protein
MLVISFRKVFSCVRATGFFPCFCSDGRLLRSH